jgi:hypothetical protein
VLHLRDISTLTACNVYIDCSSLYCPIHYVFALYAHNKSIYWQGIYHVSFPSCCTANEEKARQVICKILQSWKLYCSHTNIFSFTVPIAIVRDDTKSYRHFQPANEQGCTLINASPYLRCRIVILLRFKGRTVTETKTLDLQVTSCFIKQKFWN